MRFVVESGKINHLDIHQASVIYMDACFILAAINYEDGRHDCVMDALEHLADKDAQIVVNSHVNVELLRNLLGIKLLRAIEVHHQKVATVPQTPILSPENQNELVDPAAAEMIYNVVKKNDLLTIRGRKVTGNPYQIIKFVKQYFHQRQLLKSFYKNTEDTYTEFLKLLSDYGINVLTVSVDSQMNDTARAYTTLFSIDIADALHLAIARWSGCDMILTLDGDFEVATYSNEKTDKIITIIRVA